MSTDRDLLERWIGQALQRPQPPNRHDDANGHGGGETNAAPPPAEFTEPDEIERMLHLIEAASAEARTFDLGRMETAFAGQAAALDVIFGQFTRAAARKYYTFDSMRLALRAQAQCRATYKALIDFKAPRPLRQSRRAVGASPLWRSGSETCSSGSTARRRTRRSSIACPPAGWLN
jgi:hypothetical protein